MAKNIKRYRREYEREHPEDKEFIRKLGSYETAIFNDLLIDFIPPTFNLPTDYRIFVEEYKKCKLYNVYVLTFPKKSTNPMDS